MRLVDWKPRGFLGRKSRFISGVSEGISQQRGAASPRALFLCCCPTPMPPQLWQRLKRAAFPFHAAPSFFALDLLIERQYLY